MIKVCYYQFLGLQGHSRVLGIGDCDGFPLNLEAIIHHLQGLDGDQWVFKVHKAKSL